MPEQVVPVFQYSVPAVYVAGAPFVVVTVVLTGIADNNKTGASAPVLFVVL